LSIAASATAIQQSNKEFGVAANLNEQKTVVRFYKARQRIYEGLLIFVVVIGLPIVGVPSLRECLSQRVLAFKMVISYNSIVPVTLKVGENKQPFPAEYERPAPILPSPPKLPPLDRIFTQERNKYAQPGQPAQPSPTPARAPAPVSPAAPRASASRKEPVAPDRPELSITREEPPEVLQDFTRSDEPKYKMGQIEQNAYDLLLKTFPAVAKMVEGKNPELHFKSWDAASRGDDVYWVRLKFQSKESSEIEYIWVVKLQSNQVTPFNYNAREIS
jgi:hypothetical protein